MCTRPTNAKELFNLRHASLRNVIERIFGVCKRRFRLMSAAAEYNIRTQAKIPGAIAVLHNFIQIFDPDDLAHDDGDNPDLGIDGDSFRELPPINPDHLGRHISQAEKDRAGARRDEIANAMWVDYVAELQARQMI